MQERLQYRIWRLQEEDVYVSVGVPDTVSVQLWRRVEKDTKFISSCFVAKSKSSVWSRWNLILEMFGDSSRNIRSWVICFPEQKGRAYAKHRSHYVMNETKKDGDVSNYRKYWSRLWRTTDTFRKCRKSRHWMFDVKQDHNYLCISIICNLGPVGHPSRNHAGYAHRLDVEKQKQMQKQTRTSDHPMKDPRVRFITTRMDREEVYLKHSMTRWDGCSYQFVGLMSAHFSSNNGMQRNNPIVVMITTRGQMLRGRSESRFRVSTYSSSCGVTSSKSVLWTSLTNVDIWLQIDIEKRKGIVLEKAVVLCIGLALHQTIPLSDSAPVAYDVRSGCSCSFWLQVLVMSDDNVACRTWLPRSSASLLSRNQVPTQTHKLRRRNVNTIVHPRNPHNVVVQFLDLRQLQNKIRWTLTGHSNPTNRGMTV